MKIKQKQNICSAFVLRIKKYFIYQTPLVLLFAVLFVFALKCEADELPIISAVQIKGANANDDFIEIYNPGCGDKDISGWKLRKRISSGSESSIKVLDDNTTIYAKSYFLWSNSGLAATVNADQSTGATLSENYSIALIDDENIIDSITWGNNLYQFSGSHWYIDNFTASQVLKKDIDDVFKIEEKYFPKNATFTKSEELELCQKEEPESIPVTIPEKKEYPKNIIITELFPNPFKSEYEEYIELYNGNEEDIDLIGWELHDASKTGKYVFPESLILKTKKYLAIFKKDFKFALNNSGEEKIILLNPNGTEIANIKYNGSKRNISYNFNGTKWSWSKFLTPGKENIFNNEPYGTLKIDEGVFENTYVNFEISLGDLDGDKVKVTWDFGDKHKSYLSKTRHKYELVGEYSGSVKLSDGTEDIIKEFKVEVKKFPHPEIKIVAISANPFGNDTGVEFITVQNKSKKKINLNGWSIATGWKKFVNHPIREDVIIKGKKEKQITNEVSSFTLNNTKAKIQLRYPDGKIAHEVKYKSKEKSVAEGATYVKVKGGWSWLEAKQDTKIKKQETSKLQIPIIKKTEELSVESFVVGPSADEADNQSLNLEENEEIKMEFENKLVLLSNEGVRIELLKSQPRVVNSETVREIDGIYFFTPQKQEQEHYAVVFLKSIFAWSNFKINSLLNNFLIK